MSAVQQHHYQLSLDVISPKNLQSVKALFTAILTHNLRRSDSSFSGLSIHYVFRTFSSVIFVFSGRQNMIFLRNRAAKSTSKIYFLDWPYCISLGSLASHLPGVKRGAKIKSRKSELNTVKQKFICIDCLENTQLNYFIEMSHKTLYQRKTGSISSQEY